MAELSNYNRDHIWLRPLTPKFLHSLEKKFADPDLKLSQNTNHKTGN